MQDQDFYEALNQIFPAVMRSAEISSKLGNTKVATALWTEVDRRLELSKQPTTIEAQQ